MVVLNQKLGKLIDSLCLKKHLYAIRNTGLQRSLHLTRTALCRHLQHHAARYIDYMSTVQYSNKEQTSKHRAQKPWSIFQQEGNPADIRYVSFLLALRHLPDTKTAGLLGKAQYHQVRCCHLWSISTACAVSASVRNSSVYRKLPFGTTIIFQTFMIHLDCLVNHRQWPAPETTPL